MIALAFFLSIAAVNPAVGVEEGEAAPFTGVLVDNERAGELVLSEAEAKACKQELKVRDDVIKLWKEAASAQRVQPESSNFGFALGVSIGVTAGIGLTVGAFVLASQVIRTTAVVP